MYKKSLYLFIISFLFVASYIRAQEIADVDIIEEDSIPKSVTFSWSIAIEGQFELTDPQESNNKNTYYGISIEYKRFLAGFYYNEFLTDMTAEVIFPNSFSLHSSSGGAYLGTRIIDRRIFGLSSRMLVGVGDILWRRTDNEIDFERDVYTMVKPELIFEFQPTMISQLYIGLGYKFISEFDLVNYGSNDLAGLTVSAGIKLGFFHKPNDEN